LYAVYKSCFMQHTRDNARHSLVKLLFLILFLNRAPLRSKVTPAAPPEFLRPFSISSAPGNHSRTEPKRIRRHRAGEPEMLLALPVVLLAGAGAFLLFKFATVVDGTPLPSPIPVSLLRSILSCLFPWGFKSISPVRPWLRCRRPDARVARPAAVGEGGRQGRPWAPACSRLFPLCDQSWQLN
jgi:hypothetical protein